jgi:hypothetical protein
MTHYELIADKLQKMVDNNEITLEEAESCNDLAFLEYVSDLYTEDKLTLEEYDELVSEDAKKAISKEAKHTKDNYSKYMEVFKKYFTTFKTNEHDIKSLIRKKDFDSAASKINDCIKIIEDMQKEIADIEDDVPTTVLVYARTCITNMVKGFNTVVFLVPSILVTAATIKAGYDKAASIDLKSTDRNDAVKETLNAMKDTAHSKMEFVDSKETKKKLIAAGAALGISAAVIGALQVRHAQIKTGNIGEFKMTAKVCLSKEKIRLENLKSVLLKSKYKEDLKPIKKEITSEKKDLKQTQKDLKKSVQAWKEVPKLMPKAKSI